MTFAATAALADVAGAVHFVRMADSSFDQYTLSPPLAGKEWISGHVWRMGAYSPYFDSRTSWYPNGWVYDDAYAIYGGSQLASQHPDWILRDAAGSMLYIPFGCSGGTCPQYAGDISNPGFRHHWIENAMAEFARGYRGVFVDDVNMDMQVGNGQGESIAPIDPTTGAAMTSTAWRGYMARFMQEVRAALPGTEIVHNVIWFAADHAGASDPSIRSELSSANYVYLERGVNDSGLTGGTGSWSVNALLSYVDEIHALGRGIVLDGVARDPQGLEYNLAAYFLVSAGNDGVSGGGQTPENWWAGWSESLGEASGARYTWEKLLRRNFSGGIVLVNPPGAPARTVSLAAPMRDINGNTITSVTLAAASGAILRDGATASPLASSRAGSPTHTVLETAVVSSPAPGDRSTLARARGMVLRARRGRVTIDVQVSRSRRWTALRHLTVAVDAAGRFVRLLHLHAGTRYRVRAVYSGAPGYRPSRSAYRVILAHAR
jgi:Hypothetical glycosyl hydrolase family 15